MKNLIAALILCASLNSCVLEVHKTPPGQQFPSGQPLYCDATTWYDAYYNNYSVGCLEWTWCSNIRCYQCTWWDDATEMDCYNNVYYW